MATPALQEFYRAVLEIARDSGQRMSRNQIYEAVATRFNLTDDDKNQRTPSTGRIVADDRAYWAAGSLKRAGLLSQPARGYFQVTQQGRDFLSSNSGAIGAKLLSSLRVDGEHSGGEILPSVPTDEVEESLIEVAPQELMNQAHLRLYRDLVTDLLTSIKNMSPDRFEDLVADLLVKMGYGQSEERGPRSRDGGIDGIINQDALGLEKVYLQAKQWGSQVSAPEITRFSGSLDQFGASRGVFITSSSFSAPARQAADDISKGNKFIRLIDGPELARLMIAYGVGVVTEFTYDVKRLDENYFADI